MKLGMILLATTMLTVPASATTYNIDLSAVGATGTITTDGVIGDLGPGDITDWSITLHAPSFPRTDYDFTFTPANSYLAGQFGPDMTEDQNSLFWNFQANDNELFSIQVRSEPPSCSCWLVMTTDYSNGPTLRAQGSNFALAATFNVPTAIGAAVPEPSTWMLMLIGLAWLGTVVRRRIA